MYLSRLLALLVLGCSACSRDPLSLVRPDDPELALSLVGAAASARVSQVSLGRFHACAVLSDGVVRCVGRNDYGQLGDGSVEDRIRPVRVLALSDAVEVAVGDYHTCARRVDGTVMCWGYDAAGQLGDGLRVDRSVPWPVLGLEGVEQLALGAHHSCARTRAPAETGAVWCWGYGADGELGDGGTADRPTPMRVSLPGATRRIVAGSYHTCALGPTDLHCWGGNMAGQLGDGTMNNRERPVAVRGLGPGRVIDVALGFAHTCVRLREGADEGVVSCFGANFEGQLGDGTHEARLVPTVGRELHGRAVRLSLGFSHTCVLFDTGRARCVGDVHAPFDRDLREVNDLAVGGNSICVVSTNGAVRCDGWEPYRQLLAP